ncbi:N-acetylmuramoyl-L-alanine amidase AmiB [Providencia stuartii]|uniref:N-acetylmuramoyl-L-alanine amidase n=1 Tax=Providencia stuartii (strain MRSN 2154) TaxID=1157951 RepID=A0A140NKD9_PROSM|nr:MULTISPECIES: N-acetylmuramoyl-L-alanine amidase AmiB [Providencia]AFH94224.1 N-acetylmuramoyl-L-alanine amidase [Providencia stuartii MRSN 2154]MDE8746301.1 N-acetylmuramoyl-L-alanine amidase AmiB [Providencia thailandensis]MDE8764911.1 N-acetylmuramoyl-L-alanine amidase AmiB [Providencia thailandensis]MDE8777559.1 N-acetylmuramoyl-L-alanine amidase AmiB [Providencia thailandensis]MDE8781548.1 N-acetylmuramoyl-L-alanine amidase AmiB [Providencia thailandensis]
MTNALPRKITKRSFFSFLLLLMIVALWLVARPVQAATLSNIQVDNSPSNAQVTLSFMDGKPDYKYFPLHSPERLVIDVKQNGEIIGLPMRVPAGDLVKVVRTSQPPDSRHKRIVLELSKAAKVQTSLKQVAGQYQVVFTLSSGQNRAPTSFNNTTQPMQVPNNAVQDKPLKMNSQAQRPAVAPAPVKTNKTMPKGAKQVVIAIDAGHGGKDPGAIGKNGYREKDVTLSVARKLYAKLEADPMFKPAMTRDGDYFISVSGRSDVARKKGANMLVSIHADSAPNSSARGASVWVLSNRRANSELGNWLEQREKQSELLGGAGDALSGADPYLSQAVLDLQFGHSQRVGYDVAVQVLHQLRKVGNIHKRSPEHASLGVLRSPDIPSILVETGFISNSAEEQLLKSNDYQEKVAEAIHQGLRQYFLVNPLQAAPN